MDRKQFIQSLGALGLGSGLCPLLGSATASAQATAPTQAPEAPQHPCEQKVKFAEAWITRLCTVLDQNLDEPTKTRILLANGHACARNYLDNEGGEVRPAKFEELIARLHATGGNESARAEGNVIHFQYMQNYQGKPAPEGTCLCPLVESKPAGLSGTYCLCSVGYIEELFGRKFGQKVKVGLVESVLRGGKRCKFTIELA